MVKIDVDWSIPKATNFDQVLRRYKRYLEDRGDRESTIDGYLGNVRRYLVFSGTDRPTLQDWENYNDYLHERKLSRSTLNQIAYAARSYHRMLGGDLPVKRLEPHNEIPHYFHEEDVIKIFSVISNIKHLAMLETLFFACIRVSELINIDDSDIDIGDQKILIKEGKGGRAGIAYLNDESARILQQYLEIRPSLEIEGRRPLFYTQTGQRWNRTEVSRMFLRYKKEAGVVRPGGIHVFGRHTPASILVKNGCDILTIKEIMRHKDITTTARYLHISDEVKRTKYNQYLKL
ncbi:MAG: tyrosine-type recombinase/integrase [Methanothrix sp.]